METLNRMPFRARKSVFDKLEKIVDIASLSKEEREKYDESIKVYRDNLAVMAYAKQEGREESRKERTLSIAYNLLTMGMSPEKISQATDLSVEEILSLNL